MTGKRLTTVSKISKPASYVRDKIRKGENGHIPVNLFHMLGLLLGVGLIVYHSSYHHMNPVVQIIILVLFLGQLLGIAQVTIPTFKSKFLQLQSVGLSSNALDSYIVLDLVKKFRTVEEGQNRDEVMSQVHAQPTEGVLAVFRTLCTFAALVGGLGLWFGELFAAGAYNNYHRTGILSALYIVPPMLIFLSILGIHASWLPIQLVPNNTVKVKKRDVVEFLIGVGALLYFHNPLLCLGGLLVYAFLTRQEDHLLDVFKHHTEWSVMFVLLNTLVWGGAVMALMVKIGFDKGQFLPIIPSFVQSVLWGLLYRDDTVHFWVMIRNLSTGALLLPTGSLVGIMLFDTLKSWRIYIRYSWRYALLWFGLVYVYMWLLPPDALPPMFRFLEQWAVVAH